MNPKQLDVERFHMPAPLWPEKMITGEQFLKRRLFNDGLLVMHKGAVLHESYRNGLTTDDRHVLYSCTKSLCAMLVAMSGTKTMFSLTASIAINSGALTRAKNNLPCSAFTGNLPGSTSPKT